MQNNTTPFDVGRTFVHQYYTLLHQAPQMLHRFYSHDSTFIHGGLDRSGVAEQPAVGPENIANRILELNIRNCHAKIRQVDSHLTISNGVVIQVTGELSNDGQPMRRFMQTFVLAPREPKKYYVQNDIFRYQDEVFEEGSDEDDQSSSQDKVSNADSSVVVSQHSTSAVNISRPAVEEEQPLPQRRPVVQTVTVVAQQPTTIETNNRSEEENGVNSLTQYQEVQESVKTTSTESQPPKPIATEGIASSYAGVAKMKASSSASNIVTNIPVNPAPTPIPTNQARTSNNKTRTPTNQRTSYEPIRSNNRGPPSNEIPATDQRNQPIAYVPNDQQVFVGSIPQHFTRQDLIECFSEFGNVIDAKVTNPVQDYKKKYGFVTFDNAATAKLVVGKQHITYKEFRINVEQKIQKPSSGNSNGQVHQRNSYPQRGGRGGSVNYSRLFRNGGMNSRRDAEPYQNAEATINSSQENEKVST